MQVLFNHTRTKILKPTFPRLPKFDGQYDSTTCSRLSTGMSSCRGAWPRSSPIKKAFYFSSCGAPLSPHTWVLFCFGAFPSGLSLAFEMRWPNLGLQGWRWKSCGILTWVLFSFCWTCSVQNTLNINVTQRTSTTVVAEVTTQNTTHVHTHTTQTGTLRRVKPPVLGLHLLYITVLISPFRSDR